MECIKSVDELSMRVVKAAAGPRIRPSHISLLPCLWDVDILLAMSDWHCVHSLLLLVLEGWVQNVTFLLFKLEKNYLP